MKITTPGDLGLLSGKQDGMPCTGFGYDVHRYGGTRPLVLGGVPMEGGFTVEAHSDGDVLLHALMDALLGLSGKGDIGELFPDSDPAFDGISSAVLLSRVLDVIRESGIISAGSSPLIPTRSASRPPQRKNLASQGISRASKPTPWPRVSERSAANPRSYVPAVRKETERRRRLSSPASLPERPGTLCSLHHTGKSVLISLLAVISSGTTLSRFSPDSTAVFFQELYCA